jgi:hypothetical protein
MRLLRSLFFNLALGKFLDVQAAFGATGVHAKLVDISLDLLRGPFTSSCQVIRASLLFSAYKYVLAALAVLQTSMANVLTNPAGQPSS